MESVCCSRSPEPPMKLPKASIGAAKVKVSVSGAAKKGALVPLSAIGVGLDQLPKETVQKIPEHVMVPPPKVIVVPATVELSKLSKVVPGAAARKANRCKASRRTQFPRRGRPRTRLRQTSVSCPTPPVQLRPGGGAPPSLFARSDPAVWFRGCQPPSAPRRERNAGVCGRSHGAAGRAGPRRRA